MWLKSILIVVFSETNLRRCDCRQCETFILYDILFLDSEWYGIVTDIHTHIWWTGQWMSSSMNDVLFIDWLCLTKITSARKGETNKTKEIINNRIYRTKRAPKASAYILFAVEGVVVSIARETNRTALGHFILTDTKSRNGGLARDVACHRQQQCFHASVRVNV